MQAQIRLGRIFGIEIGLHYSWLIIAVLITFSVSAQFYETNPQWGSLVIWTSAILTAALFFAAIILHELSHAAVAKMRGLPVRSITLFALGGVALIEKEAEDAKTEFLMAVVGPFTSFLIGGLCLLLASAAGWSSAAASDTPFSAILMWLGFINVGLAVFNLVPGFPMDGGRVLRGFIWWLTGDAERATKISSVTGQVVALGFILIGVVSFFAGGGLGGVWIAFIGWFLLDAARASYAEVMTAEALRGTMVRDVMDRNFSVVEGWTNLRSFVEDELLRTGRRCFVVEENDRPVGLITAHEVKQVTPALWPYKTVAEVMLPLARLHTISADTPVTEALETMGREDVNQLPVVRDGRFAGIISRGHILTMLHTRTELHAARG